MSAKARGGGTGKSVEKKLTFDKNLLLVKNFHKMLYHQTTTNQTKKNELKIILSYKYGLMRPSKGIINLDNLRTMFGYLFEEIKFTANAKSSMQVSPCTTANMQKVQCKCLHAQQPCKNLTHLICTAVFSATF